MKKRELLDGATEPPFTRISEEIIFLILDVLACNPLDVKAFSLACKYFHEVESRHRKILRPLRVEHLSHVLLRYPHVSHLDLTLCPRVNDNFLSLISNACKGSLKLLDLSRSCFFSGIGLSSLAERCLNLISLNLSNSAIVRDSTLSAVAQMANLENLWLSRCNMITDMGIGCVAVGCGKLRMINLKWSLNITDLGVDLIAVKCKEIRSMDLSYLPITNKSLSSVLKLQHLEELILEGCSGIDESLLPIAKHTKKPLKKINLSSCTNITHRGLSSLTNGADSIQDLIFSYGPQVTPPFVETLKSFQFLRSLILDGSALTDSALKVIGNLTVSLHDLSMSKCSGVSDEALSFVLPKHKDLKRIDITCCRRISATSISNIATYCTNLVSLKMESCSLVNKRGFSVLGKCTLLQELDLTDNEIDNHGLKSIATCVNLTSLKLGICLNISDEGVAAIGSNCANLVEVDLYRCGEITDLSLSAIGNGCPKLEAVNVSYCSNITDCSLISLSNCLKLRTLECRGCPFITSIGISAVALRCKQLTKVDIKKCHSIDNKGMTSLGKYSHYLRQINLSFTAVTDVGIVALTGVSCVQSVTVLHVNGLTAAGITAALLGSCGLRKAKLHSSFRSLIPRAVHDLLSARGCVFEWRDKELRPELDPKWWKQQLPVTPL